MAEARIRFGQFRELLLDLGFREIRLSTAHIAFEHKESDTVLALPVY